MVAEPEWVRINAAAFTEQELRDSLRAVAVAMNAPDSLTGETLDGTSMSLAPRSLDECKQIAANLQGAIELKVSEAAGESLLESGGHFLDLSNRALT
ncbi:MAG: hypothetical protein AAF236_00735 [Verrucomicrobiota bacterium]